MRRRIPGVARVALASGSTALALLLLCPTPARCQQPVPDLEVFLKRAQEALQPNELFAQYTYRQKLVSHDIDAQGQIRKTSVRVYQVWPDRWGSPANRILIERDGVQVPETELARSERRRLAAARERSRRLQRESSAERAHRMALERRSYRAEAAAIDEAFQLSDPQLIGREMIDGRPAIVVAFRPRPDFEATTFIGKLLVRAVGRVWFSEADHQLVRVEAESIETIRYAWGFVARVHPGSRLTLHRRRISGEIWMPAGYHVTGAMRILLVKERRFDVTSEFYDYRKIRPEESILTTDSVP